MEKTESGTRWVYYLSLSLSTPTSIHRQLLKKCPSVFPWLIVFSRPNSIQRQRGSPLRPKPRRSPSPVGPGAALPTDPSALPTAISAAAASRAAIRAVCQSAVARIRITSWNQWEGTNAVQLRRFP